MAQYISLSNTQEVDDLIEQSHDQPVIIFKHSTSCSISSLAKARVDGALRTGSLTHPVYLLDLLRHRDVSNYIAERLEVRHESPQVILVDAGRSSYVATHLDIDPAAIHVAN